MSRTIKLSIGLGLLFGLMAARPAMADEATAAFQTNVQKAISTLNDMQSLFARMDQRKAQQAASASAPAPGVDQSR